MRGSTENRHDSEPLKNCVHTKIHTFSFFFFFYSGTPHCLCVSGSLQHCGKPHHRPLGSHIIASKPLSPLWSMLVCVSVHESVCSIFTCLQRFSFGYNGIKMSNSQCVSENCNSRLRRDSLHVQNQQTHLINSVKQNNFKYKYFHMMTAHLHSNY